MLDLSVWRCWSGGQTLKTRVSFVPWNTCHNVFNGEKPPPIKRRERGGENSTINYSIEHWFWQRGGDGEEVKLKNLIPKIKTKKHNNHRVVHGVERWIFPRKKRARLHNWNQFGNRNKKKNRTRSILLAEAIMIMKYFNSSASDCQRCETKGINHDRILAHRLRKQKWINFWRG